MGSSQETIERAARLVGKMLRDKWRLDALIGVGGMASVYSATHRNGKRAAIKLLNRDLSEGDSTRARFLREGYVANKVGHPGVVNVLDDDTSDDGRAFLVMELLEGETLKARWSRWNKRMPVDEVLRGRHAVLDVLDAAHDKGIVNRDVKPDNIFLTNDGAVKVLDFGIARLRETGEAADATRSSAMLGTPAFMAPEQARSRWEWVDARTDVWAVGATRFTALTGQFVHNAGTGTELLVTAAMMPARPIRQVMPELPEGVAAIIDRALAFDQAQRWADAKAMQAAIGFALRPNEVAPLTNPTLVGSFDGYSSAVRSGPVAAPAPPSRPAMPSQTDMGPTPALMPRAALLNAPLQRANPKTEPIPTQKFDAEPHPKASSTFATAVLPPSQLQPAPAFQPMAAPIAQPPQPGLSAPLPLSHSQSGMMQSPLQPSLAHSQPGMMQSPLAGAIAQPAPEPPGVSTLVAAATGSATLNATRSKSKTNPLVFAAVGGIFMLGLIAAFFVVRSGGDSDPKETNAGAPPTMTSNVAAPPVPNVAPIIETASPTPSISATTNAPPADSASADGVSASQPRQTNTTKPRTTQTKTKKRDPFDKY